MEFEKYKKKMGRNLLSYPNTTQTRIRINEADHITHLLSVPNHAHGWDFFTKTGVIKILTNKQRKGLKTFLIIPKNVIIKSGFTTKKGSRGYPVYRFMPEKNTIFLVQSKAMLNQVMI